MKVYVTLCNQGSVDASCVDVFADCESAIWSFMRRVQDEDDPPSREEILDSLTNGHVFSYQDALSCDTLEIWAVQL